MKYILYLVFSFMPIGLIAHEGLFQEPIKCGTFMPPHEQRTLVQVCDFDFTMRHIMDKNYISPGGNFLIHYDIKGEHAVEIIDENNNGIPDYVDSVAYYADFAYQQEVVEMGYYSPLPEPGGSSDLYDIYLYELGEGPRLYGLTQSDKRIPLEIGDKGHEKYYSFIAIDNDYSPKDSVTSNGKRVKSYKTDGYEALKVTLIHEFHHAIQFTYGELSFGSLFAELTSTFMEYRVFPEIKDYYQYVDYLFESLYKYPFGVDNYLAGYSYSIFGQYLYKQYGDDMLRRTWEIIDQVNDRKITYQEALDSALKEEGTNLVTIWKDFQPYIYYTGSRTQGTNYLDDAADLPEIIFYQEQETDQGMLYSSGLLKPMEQRGLRFTLRYKDASSDTLDIILANLDTKNYYYNTPKQSKYSLLCSSDRFDGAINEQNKDVFWSKDNTESNSFIIPYLHKGNNVVFLDYAFPNPYIPKQHSNMFLPIPQIENLYKTINVVVFSADMNEVFSGSYPLIVRGDSKTVVDISDKAKDLGSGVYLFKISTEDNDFLGKFVVKDSE